MTNTNTVEERKFFDAINNRQGELIEQLVESNPKFLDAFDYQAFGATPATSVCFRGDRTMLATLIKLGVDLNRRSDWSMGPWSPLHCAVMKSNHELAHVLVESGAVLDAHGAAGIGDVESLQRLIDESPGCVSELGGDGCQPLHFADTPEVAELLLQHGADMNARCVDHYSTPVQYLAPERSDVARFLFSKGATADIFSAIVANDKAMVSKMLAADPGAVNARINQDFFPPGPEYDVHNILTFTIGGDSTPMHAAAGGNQAEMVSLLAGAGLSPDIRGGYDQCSALHLAAWNDHVEVASALLDHGADIDLRSGQIHNNTPAGWAIVAGSASVFEMLMDRGATILDGFADDVQTALAGKFQQYKCVDPENYGRIAKKLDSGIG